ncbi:hypothetical protein GGI07_001893 [Coemansia sp. Benny D115]|nr:hypothetical protein GGI07_001893 [Coemansia sp. Benny D115]
MFSNSSSARDKSTRAPAREFDSDDDDSGELWISPKISRTTTRETTLVSDTRPLLPSEKLPPPLRQVQSETASQIKPQELARSLNSHVHSRRKAHVRNTRQQQQQQNSASLSWTRVAAWYVTRVLLLFLIGWVWSVGVQLIHAQHNTSGVDTSGYESSGDSSSDESDGEFPYEILFGWPVVDAGAEGITRDLISRVLSQAAWCNGLSGLLTVLIGLTYPYLDYKWQGQRSSLYGGRTNFNDILRCVGGFLGINYAALKLPFESAMQSAVIMIIIALGLWTVCDSSFHGLLLSLCASLMATWVLFVHALASNSDGVFTNEDYLSLLSYLPSVLFTYCIMAGSIGRRIGCRSPLWQNKQQAGGPGDRRYASSSGSVVGLRAVSSTVSTNSIVF